MHRKLLLLLSVILGTLLILEIIFRIFSIQPFEDAGDSDWKMKGDLTKLGIRDIYTSTEKEPGVWRILLLGDSIPYGACVDKTETFVKNAERIIQTSVSPKIQIWNCSKPGWDTEQEINYLSDKGISFQPDMVIVCFFLNDATYYSSLFPAFHKLREKNSIEQASHLYNWISKRIMIKSISSQTTDLYSDSYFKPKNGQNRWENCKTAFLRAKSICAERKIPLAVMIFPCLVDLNDSYPFQEIHDLVLDFCHSNEIQAFDLLPAFKGYPAMELRNRIDDGHPNAQGHEIAGQALSDWLIKSNNIPGYLKKNSILKNNKQVIRDISSD